MCSKEPATWYNALMDLGVCVKACNPTITRRAAQYRKQSTFVGSRRQVRGGVVRELTAVSHASPGSLAASLGSDIGLVTDILKDLEKEGFLESNKGVWRLARSL